MMQLKLAEYNKDGKFERLLSLGRKPDHFIFFGDGISYIQAKEGEQFSWVEHTLQKDEKDPLNRFNGLFNGRTYGEGRFVLIMDENEDSVFCRVRNKPIVWQHYYDDEIRFSMTNKLGNLHENPELFEKIK